MYEDFRRELSVSLCSVISDTNLLKNVLCKVDEIANAYTFDTKITDLVPASQLTAEAVKSYLANCRLEGQSEGTIHNKFYALTKFFNTVKAQIMDITTNDVRAYLYTISTATSDKNTEKTRQYLSKFFDYCVEEELIVRNPVKKINRIKTERAEIQPLKDDELKQIREAVNSPMEKCIIEFMYSSGCRVSELAGLKISDLDYDNHEVHLFGKGKKHRTAFLSQVAIDACKEYIATRTDDCPYLIVSRRGHHSITSDAIRDIIHEISARCGLYINPHQIRHTTATNLQKEMPIQNISKYLGHENISTTMIYAQINREEMKNEFGRVMN